MTSFETKNGENRKPLALEMSPKVILRLYEPITLNF